MNSEDGHTEAVARTDVGRTDQNHNEAQQGQTMKSSTIVATTTTTSMQQVMSQPHVRPTYMMPPGDNENLYSQPRLHPNTSTLNRSVIGQRYDSQASIADDQTGMQDDQEVAYTDEQAAAETLVNLRSRSAVSWSYGDTNTRGSGKIHQEDPRRQSYQNIISMSYERSSEHNAAAGGESAATMTQSMDPSLHAYTYSSTIRNMQNTITGLGIAMDNIQAQQVYMHTQQETMSSAMQQVMAMLQLLTKEKQGLNHSNHNSQIQNQRSNLVLHGDLQGENRTVSTRVNCGPTDQGTVTYRAAVSAEAPSTYIGDTQSRNCNPCSDQDVASNLQPAYRYNETNTQQSHGVSFPTDYHQRWVHRSLGQINQTDRLNNEVPIRSSQSGQDTGYTTSYATDRADIAEDMPNYRWAERGQHYTEGPKYTEESRQAQCQTSLARKSGTERHNDNRGRSTREPYDAKIPPFNGKEDWKVWVNRFEAVAERRNWDDET